MAQIKADEITKIIREQIENFDRSVTVAEVGSVISVGDGVARIHGLDRVMAGELLSLPHDVAGLALNLEEDQVSAVLLGDYTKIKEGDTVKRTNRIMSVPVGDALVGRVVDALGRPTDGKGPILTDEYSPIERIAPGVVDRQPVREPLQTGIKAIDSMIPIGRGQRELIIGDRQTGKTAVALDAILNQRGGDVIAIAIALLQAAEDQGLRAFQQRLKGPCGRAAQRLGKLAHVLGVADQQLFVEEDHVGVLGKRRLGVPQRLVAVLLHPPRVASLLDDGDADGLLVGRPGGCRLLARRGPHR